MNSAHLNYQALAKGGIITLGLSLVLINNGLIIIDSTNVSSLVYLAVHFISFVSCWLLTTYLVSKFPLYQVLGVLSLLLIAMIAERYMHISKNPFTVPLIILFWLGVTYLVLPQFFQKYKTAIFAVYGSVIAYYFFLFRMTPEVANDHRLNFANFMLLPIPVFAALWVYEQWRWLVTLKADKAKAELALLKSQVNPHFFFNTLNNLYGLVIEKSAQAPEVVLKLSDMMRYTIYKGKEDLVNLTDEIEYLVTYLELHKIRYQKRVDIVFNKEVEKEIRIAPLLFIILLENAFKHGAEKLIENAYIHLDLKMHNDQVFFTISNNYEPGAVTQKAGIGLKNLSERLTHSYPNRHDLQITKKDSTYTVHLNLDLRP